MKKIIPLLAVAFLLAGCQAAPSQPTTPPVAPPSAETPVYPNRDAKVGQKYGEMIFENISADGAYANFKGNVTLSGEYTYFGKEELSTLADRVCVTLSGNEEVEKLPVSEALHTEDVSEKFLCFSNNDRAKELFGTGKGKATFTISSLKDVIDAQGEFISEAVLESLSTKSDAAFPAFVYPDRKAVVGQKYGAMEFAGWDKSEVHALFKGEVTLTGSYEYSGEDGYFPNTHCFTVEDQQQSQKLPFSQTFYTMHQEEHPGDLPARGFCFNNAVDAKKLLGTGMGKATIVIDGYESVVNLEGDLSDMANLKQVISKTGAGS